MYRFVSHVCVLSSLAVSSVALANRPPLHPNGTPYNVRSPSAATGRSGTATIQARALLNASGQTDVEVTTGALDSGSAAPGTLTKIQLKSFDALGNVRWVRNFNGLNAGGRFATSVGDLLRGMKLQVQANVRGIDGRRTDVVTVTNTILRRPDLAVTTLDAPARVNVGTVANLAATVAEQNGDAGARGDCLLFVDGSQADQALGIWVDAGGTVSCAFTYQFDTQGTHSVEARIANVVPGDDNLANNSLAVEVEVVSNSQFFWWAQAYDQKYNDYFYHTQGNYRYNYGSYEYGADWDYTFDYEPSSWQAVYLSGWSPTALSFPMDVTATETSGANSRSVQFAGVNPDWSWNDGYCNYSGAWRWDSTAYVYFYLYSGQCGGSEWTSAYYNRYSGDITYFAQGYYNYWYRDGNGNSYNYYYAYNYDPASYTYGTRLPLVGSLSVGLTLDSATNQLVANAEIPLSSYHSEYTQPLYCYDYGWDYYSQHYCYEYHYSYDFTYGYAWGEN